MVGQSGINCLKAAIKIEPTANDPLLIRAASDSASQIIAQQMASKCDSGSWKWPTIQGQPKLTHRHPQNDTHSSSQMQMQMEASFARRRGQWDRKMTQSCGYLEEQLQLVCGESGSPGNTLLWGLGDVWQPMKKL